MDEKFCNSVTASCWKIIDEAATVALPNGIPSSDSCLVFQYVKELTLQREGLHEMVHCYRQEHLAAGNDLHEHPRGYSS